MLTWIEKELTDLEAASLKRHVRLKNKTLINFSSNDYLGLSRHPDMISAAQQAAAEWGTGATSSRLLAGTTPMHEHLEKRLAQVTRQEAALVFPSGYMANLGVITSLAGPGDAVVLDRLCHASIVDAARLSGARVFVYKHADADDAERVLRRAGTYRRRLLVTESLFSMDGDFAPVDALAELAKRYESMMIVDDAHAFAVRVSGPGPYGDQVQGRSVIVGTLSKALGSQGGFVAGPQKLIDWLVNKARSFIFTTALAPANAAVALAAIEIAQREGDRRARLSHMSALLRKELQNQGWNILTSQSQIIPVCLGSAESALKLAAHLEEQGFYAPAIRPPTVRANECRVRFSVTAMHTNEEIERLLKAMSFGPGPQDQVQRRSEVVLE